MNNELTARLRMKELSPQIQAIEIYQMGELLLYIPVTDVLAPGVFTQMKHLLMLEPKQHTYVELQELMNGTDAIKLKGELQRALNSVHNLQLIFELQSTAEGMQLASTIMPLFVIRFLSAEGASQQQVLLIDMIREIDVSDSVAEFIIWLMGEASERPDAPEFPEAAERYNEFIAATTAQKKPYLRELILKIESDGKSRFVLNPHFGSVEELPDLATQPRPNPRTTSQ